MLLQSERARYTNVSCGNKMIRDRNIVIKIVLAFILLLGVGCSSYESKLYKGKVVDEQGSPIQNVSIILCYTGWDWDWSMDGGFPLTMGHPFCSDPVITDQNGNYSVFFAGPPSTFIHARHQYWVQTKGFLAKNNRVVLIHKQQHNKRLAEEGARKKKRKLGETSIEYYCRVLRKQSKIEVVYNGQRVKIVPEFLLSNGRLLFAVVGPYSSVKFLAEEITINKEIIAGNEVIVSDFVVLPKRERCGEKMFFIRSNVPYLPYSLGEMERVRLYVPSARAGFPMRIQNKTDGS